jgi:hypothetical protein
VPSASEPATLEEATAESRGRRISPYFPPHVASFTRVRRRPHPTTTALSPLSTCEDECRRTSLDGRAPLPRWGSRVRIPSSAPDHLPSPSGRDRPEPFRDGTRSQSSAATVSSGPSRWTSFGWASDPPSIDLVFARTPYPPTSTPVVSFRALERLEIGGQRPQGRRMGPSPVCYRD